ncbi:MAG: diacylglycerol kinase family protein [Candidatus Moranbacteria bacterium]|jgi:undecaprenol kinase|nr:diacylglycerol kinase family protein [Candidatus Moranbacteria bacterium]MBP9801129.1 diacylglycerol kinase family protein [Candidatus Moranbacteria bacterium]
MKVRILFKSIRHAVSGIVFALARERNFQIECGVAMVVIIFAFWFPLLPFEWALLVLVIGWILTLELINTIFERILDIVKPNVHPYVRVVKDMAAGAVLIAAFVAILVGIFIFLPHLIG